MSASDWCLTDGVVLFPVADEVLIFDENAGKTHLMADDAACVIRFLFTAGKAFPDGELTDELVSEVCLALEAEGLVTKEPVEHAR